ncbi:MerR family transcriptional regulator [Candidatus Gracilibacteria bacterium]|nr:MerR family transcriptional regulator [Candidatus Gracilibacteria bacterium]
MNYSIKQLAELAGISVRTLHFYDEIGLLSPASIKPNGYRIYEVNQLLRLQQILFFRELEFSLEEIKRIISSPHFNALEALQEQKKMLMMKRDRLDKMLTTITNTITSMKKKKPIKDKKLYDVFKDNDVKKYQDEVKERWGSTDAYKQSMARVGKMSKEEMAKLKADGKAFTQKLADHMDMPIESPEVQELVAQHYKGINFFYDCPLEMYRNLGQMYVDDARFTAYYDGFRAGLAVFLRDAIAYFCNKK